MKKPILNKIIRYLALFFCGYFIITYSIKIFNNEKPLETWVDYLFFLGSIGYYVLEILDYQEKHKKSQENNETE